MAEKKEKLIKVRFPLGAKLIIIVSFLIVFSLGSITYLVNYFVGEDVRVTAENNNLDANTRFANSVTTGFTAMQANALLMLDVINNAGGSDYISKNSSTLYFERNPDIAAVVLLSKENYSHGNYDLRLVNNKFFIKNELDEVAINAPEVPPVPFPNTAVKL